MVGLMWEVPVFTSCEQDGSLMLTQASFKLKEHIHSLVTETALKSLKCGCFYVFICLASLFVSCRILSAWSAVVFLGFYNFFGVHMYMEYMSVFMYVCIHVGTHVCRCTFTCMSIVKIWSWWQMHPLSLFYPIHWGRGSQSNPELTHWMFLVSSCIYVGSGI